MIGVQIGDFLVGSIQHYMLTNMFCKVAKIKYNYGKYLLFSMIHLSFMHLFLLYGTDTLNQRIFLGIISFTIYGLTLFEGSRFYRITRALLGYVIYVGLDLACQVIFGPWIGITIQDLQISSQMLFAKNLYNVVAYLLLALFEWFCSRKASGKIKLMTILSVLIAMCQIWVFYMLLQANVNGLTERVVSWSVFYSGMVILGYCITMEVFRQIVKQQRKQAELEHKIYERKYQYDYYLLARQQGEELRDLRHDMRNQLQTMQYLLTTGGEEGKARAQGMLCDIEQQLES